MLDVTFIAKPGCHLCEVAQPIVQLVVAEFGDRVRLTELDMLQDPALAERWSDDIPVVLVDGRQHASWRVDEDRLRSRITASLDDVA